MIKKLSLFCLVVFAAATAFASGSGTWNIMPVYGGIADHIIDTPDLVYYLSKGHLFSFNKNTDETYHYSTINRLNDTGVSVIGYNPYKRYLAVGYTTHNIDLIYDSGKVVNIPDIRDASISADKTINNFEFSKDGHMYVATNFGFVVFDDDKHRVSDSGIFNEAISYACQLDGHLVIAKGNGVYASPVDDRHNNINNFKKLGNLPGSGAVFHRLGDKLLLGRNTVNSSSNSYYVVTPDFSANTIVSKKIDNGQLRMDFTTGADEIVRLASGTVMRSFNPDGTFSLEVLPSVFFDKAITTNSGMASSLWVSDINGVAEYNVKDANVTQLRAAAKPETLTCHWPAIMRLSKDGKRIYISNMGFDSYKQEPGPSWTTFFQTTNVIEDGKVRDVSYFDEKGVSIKGATQDLCEDPYDSSIYYFANDIKGVYAVKDGDILYTLDSSNSPFPVGNRSWLFNVNFDNYGNLWIGLWAADGRNPIYILPAEKLKDPENININDWIVVDVKPYSQSSGVVSFHHSGSNYVLYGCNHNTKGILVYNHNGTPTDTSDDKYLATNIFVDQDGAEVPINRIFAFEEDKNGKIWIANENGVFVINDINKAVNNNTLYMRRPKVPRNDGTNYADYLLDGEMVFDISVDPSNRKWIATSASGVYLVNEEGTEILANYTTENSILPSNKVFAVMADPHSNMVYIGTDKGLVSYSSDSAPAAEDYSDVYAYPNPVRPDYTGWVTITGLMDNSLVKITDTAGNIVAQGKSEGGLYLWDVCNMSNQRVRSGVYFVFASQNDGSSASGKPVTKIMVIN